MFAKFNPMPVLVIQKGTRVLISLWGSLMFGRVPKNRRAWQLGTRPNISESHSEISTRVPFCITQVPRWHQEEWRGQLREQRRTGARLVAGLLPVGGTAPPRFVSAPYFQEQRKVVSPYWWRWFKLQVLARVRCSAPNAG